MKRKILRVSLIFFFLVFAAGCGGGSDSSGSGDTGQDTEETDSGTEETAGDEEDVADDGDDAADGEEDTSGPLEISNLAATAGYETVTLSWTETGDTGRVEITWSPDGTTAQSVDAGSSTFTATGLALGTEYTFTATSIDGDENVTAQLTAAATPCPEGTPAGAVYIRTVAGLKAIDNDPAGYYVLLADLDLSGENWSPLAATSATRFEGTLDGNGHVISGLAISSSSAYQGLFDQINADGTLKNLGLENVSVTISNGGSAALAARNYGAISNCYSTGTVFGGYYTAGLVGYNYGGTISGSYSECNVEGTYFSGGLVGRNQDGGAITDCHATGTVTGTEALGGLAGYVAAGCTISGCYATGDVSGTGWYVGGLVGQTVDNDTTDSSYSTISNSYAMGNASGSYRIGGLVGQNKYCDISDCYAEGDITASTGLAGGLVGENTDSAITGCHASGTVSGGQYTGGLVGQNYDSETTDAYESTISDSYTTAPGVSGTISVGGLVGENANGIISFCHAEISGNVEGRRHVGGLVGYHDNTDNLADIDGIITGSFAKIGGRVNASDINAGGLAGLIDGLPVTCCYADAAGGVSADGTDGDGQNAGGLVGYCDADISNCYALSDVTGNSRLGGLVGYQYSMTVNRCYATGVVDSGTDIGGLVGYNLYGSATDSYFNSASTANGDGEAVSLADMTQQGTFDGWDFAGETANGEEDIWSMDDSATDPLNSGYPYLTDLPPDE